MAVLCILSCASAHIMGNMYVLRDIVKKYVIKIYYKESEMIRLCRYIKYCAN